jgi:hypothetical protein
VRGVNAVPPLLQFAFEIRAQVGAPLRGGAGRLGERVHVPILGGTVQGPRLNGQVLPGGGDWLLMRPDGASVIEAHYSIRADDDTPIYVHNRGLRVSSPEVLARLQHGDSVADDDMYFRSTPVFDAPDGPHGWLSDRLFVARQNRAGDAVIVQVYEVR